MYRAFCLILAVLAAGLSPGWNAPAFGGELTPETHKLFDAVRDNNFPAVRRSLLDGADIQAENFTGRTAIDLAVDKSYFSIAHYLLAWRKQRKAANTRPALPPEALETIPEKQPIPPPEPVVAEAKPEPAPKAEPEPVTAPALSFGSPSGLRPSAPLVVSQSGLRPSAPLAPPALPSSGGPATLGYNLFLTPEMSLGKNPPKKSDKICIEKKSRQRLFCIEPVLWPSESQTPKGLKETQDIGASFEVYTTLFRGKQTIVGYEKGQATQFHTLFPSKNFYAIVDYFTKQFGPPSEKPNIRAFLVGEANRKNRTARWVGPKRADGKTAVLEVREIDDLRWSAPPDTRYGVAWLYFQGADPVFRYVSWSDFLLARVRRQRN